MRILHIAAILLLVHIISMTACSREAQPETSTLSGPTAPSAGIGRRVEDPGGVTPAPTPCPFPADCSFTFSLTMASGDVLSGTCDERLATCPLAGTGRFTDAILRLYAGTTRVSSFVLTGNQLAVTLMLNLPSLGNQTFLITGNSRRRSTDCSEHRMPVRFASTRDVLGRTRASGDRHWDIFGVCACYVIDTSREHSRSLLPLEYRGRLGFDEAEASIGCIDSYFLELGSTGLSVAEMDGEFGPGEP